MAKLAKYSVLLVALLVEARASERLRPTSTEYSPAPPDRLAPRSVAGVASEQPRTPPSPGLSTPSTPTLERFPPPPASVNVEDWRRQTFSVPPQPSSLASERPPPRPTDSSAVLEPPHTMPAETVVTPPPSLESAAAVMPPPTPGNETDVSMTPSPSSSSALTAASLRSLAVLRSSSFLLVLAISMVSFTPAPLLTRELGSPERAMSALSALAAAAAAAEIVLSPVLGSVIDSVGRKPAMLAAQASVALAHATAALDPAGWSVCLARAAALLCGGQLAVISQAMIGDLTESDPDRIGAVMGEQTALVSLGFLSGSVIGGRLAGLGPLAAYGASALCSALGAINIFLRMPETLPPTKRVPFDAEATGRNILESPLSWTKLLVGHGRAIRVLSILLLLQSLPMFMGDVFQVYAAKEWNLAPQGFSNLFALVGTLGILANTISRYLIPRLGLMRFTALATISSLGFPLGTFISYEAAVVGACLGGLSAAQKLGIMAEITTQGTKTGLPQGQLAGERASLLAILKVVGPILYSALYMGGSRMGVPNLPFVFNIGLALLATFLCQQCLHDDHCM